MLKGSLTIVALGVALLTLVLAGVGYWYYQQSQLTTRKGVITNTPQLDNQDVSLTKLQDELDLLLIEEVDRDFVIVDQDLSVL